jgi:hypothetical protein
LINIDHVGVLFKDINGQIYFLDTTRRNGVFAAQWINLIKTNLGQMYSKIVYRKLQFESSPAAKQTLYTFMKSLVGKKFSLSITKLFQKGTTLESAMAAKSFFCSELVATFYKALGILPLSIASSRYLPKDFSESGALGLLNGALLMDEQVIRNIL